LPFHNYAGPGTHISENIHKGVKPISNLDRAALIHDIEYLNGNQFQADNNMFKNMVKNDIFSFPLAAITRASFFFKDIFGYHPRENKQDYNHLKSIVNANKKYFGVEDYNFY